MNHLITPVVVSMAEHFSCLKHNTHNGEILVVVDTICTQPTLKKIISLEQKQLLLLLLLLRWWLLLRWRRWKRILWGRSNHLMTPIVVSMVEHFSCLKHNTHNGEILVVVVTICTQPTLKKVIYLE